MTDSTTQSLPSAPPTAAPTSRRWRRLATIAVATLAALADWLLCTQLLDIELTVDQGAGPQPVLLALVIAAPIAAGLSGWALLALLERLLPAQGKTVWRVVAAAVLLLSNWSPLTMAESPVIAGCLVSMHLVVGLVLIIGLSSGRR